MAGLGSHHLQEGTPNSASRARNGNIDHFETNTPTFRCQTIMTVICSVRLKGTELFNILVFGETMTELTTGDRAEMTVGPAWPTSRKIVGPHHSINCRTKCFPLVYSIKGLRVWSSMILKSGRGCSWTYASRDPKQGMPHTWHGNILRFTCLGAVSLYQPLCDLLAGIVPDSWPNVMLLLSSNRSIFLMPLLTFLSTWKIINKHNRMNS